MIHRTMWDSYRYQRCSQASTLYDTYIPACGCYMTVLPICKEWKLSWLSKIDILCEPIVIIRCTYVSLDFYEVFFCFNTQDQDGRSSSMHPSVCCMSGVIGDSCLGSVAIMNDDGGSSMTIRAKHFNNWTASVEHCISLTGSKWK